MFILAIESAKRSHINRQCRYVYILKEETYSKSYYVFIHNILSNINSLTANILAIVEAC